MAVTKIKRSTIEPADERRSSSYWSLLKDGINTSGLKKFNLCPEQFRLEYVEGWAGPDDSMPLEFGNACHWFLERFYNPKVPIIKARSTGIYKAAWLKKNPGSAGSPGRLQTLENVLALSEAIWPVYTDLFADERENDWIGLEETFRFPLTIKLERRPAVRVHLRGIFDGVYRDRIDGALWLFETKTRGEIDELELIDLLPRDLQLTIYLLAIRKVFGEWPAGVIYNVIRRPKHKPAAKESILSFSRRLQGVIEKDDGHFFKRVEMRISPRKIEAQFNRQVVPMLSRLVDWALHKGPHFVNDAGLIQFHKRVPMFDPITRGDFSRCVRVGPMRRYVDTEK